jgi:geranylgeranyl pyrophosphate synthase
MDLARIFEPISAELELVELELKAIMERVARAADAKPGPLGLLRRIVEHPLSVPGKRIRPALALLSARAAGLPTVGSAAAGGDREALVSIAAAVEVLHAASLVHDDIIDGAETRRHQVSLNKRFGNRVAVLAGDILYTHFFSLVTGLPSTSAETRFALLDLFIETTKAMCMGEILAQEAGASRRPLAFADYLQISSDKTASLFSASCEAGGLVRGASADCVGSLRAFGLAFGLVFQMVDDLVDEDHGLDPKVDLGARVGEYAEIAKRAASGLPPGDSTRRLLDLVDYVAATASSAR